MLNHFTTLAVLIISLVPNQAIIADGRPVEPEQKIEKKLSQTSRKPKEAKNPISPSPKAEKPAQSVSGDCASWMKEAGITNPTAQILIGRESGCNPCAYNPGQSDCNYTGNAACGIPQALPCSKLRDVAGCAMTDAVCQLRWMENYVMNRYGSWENAKAHHDANNWY